MYDDVPSITASELPAPERFADGSAILLDVRGDDEWEVGHAPHALHIVMDEVAARTDDLDPDAEIYVICRAGGRSVRVAHYLNHYGIDATTVSDGMHGYERAGFPLVTDDGSEGHVK